MYNDSKQLSNIRFYQRNTGLFAILIIKNNGKRLRRHLKIL